jgi:hypothetical protein
MHTEKVTLMLDSQSVGSSLGARRAALVLAVGCALAMLVGCTDGDAKTKAPAHTTQPVGLLMVQEARSGTLREGSKAGEYTLSLRAPSRFVTVFTDRPQRRAWRVEARRFVESWSAYGFAQDPPNAALEAPDADPTRDLMVVELSDPRFDDSGTLTYTAREGSKQKAGGAAFQRPVDELSAASFERPSLFIDSGTSPNPSGWTQACSMERGSSNTSGYIWHCTWPNKQSKPSDALNVLASKCPGSFNYDQNRDASCVT